MDTKEAISKIHEFVITYGINIVAAILIFIIGRWLAGVISRFIEKVMLKSKTEKTLAGFVKNISYVVIITFVIIAALNKLGIHTTSLLSKR
jgi:small conductance mechanosensitive channel